ncbi:haloacid dehalogenase, type II [Methylobacterium sp. 4-46]|uniref:haloacid dehalogenase type II n=1 Tax=unclassified Methylobacterium TaxID=2615210 RepID=UPI000152E5FF|nr:MULTISPECIES: haloacid dehalogenase type II [Methylobacterium]ACA20010.1 haloacid dehalogenase, type II [Methylobacterium sp. 4-46]WFT79197.1 haloacid dehalogenase type II [Methylobacterium nodulans]
MMPRPKLIACDVIGTLVSLERMRPLLTGLGLPPAALEIWFASALRDAFALAITDRFAPFRLVLRGELASLLSAHGLPVRMERLDAVLDGMAELDPQPDAAEALALLTEAGFRVAALSNGSAEATEQLLRRGGLHRHVEMVLSIDQVQRSKPRAEVYLSAAQAAGVAPGEAALVAAHAWDTHGAKVAGLGAAFVARGQIYPRVLVQPDLQGEALRDVALALAALDPAPAGARAGG